MINPVLTIIIPLYDAEDDIEELFLSLKSQINIKKSEIEIILINDGSNDTTLTVIEENLSILNDFKSTKTISNDGNLGLSKTRLIGAIESSGDFLTFIDKKTRPNNDYIENFLNKERNIIIGNPYINKSRSSWGRVLSLVRKKVYWPYFNNDFNDISLDHQAYLKFKNKGGGGALFVRRDYYIKIAKNQSHNPNINDDSKFIEELSKIEPVLKTSSAKTEYINRSGFKENILHLYNRGPKFIDYYFKPGSRYFPYIIGLLLVLLILMIVAVFNFYTIGYFLLLFMLFVCLVSAYISENILDFFYSLLILPLAFISFSSGIIKGIMFKILKKY